MITINMNNNTFNCKGNIKVLNEIRKAIRVRNPNAFYLRRFMPKGWDGFNQYMTDTGTCMMGLLPTVIGLIKSMNEPYEVKDFRKPIEVLPLPKSIGGMIPRDYQIKGANSILNNTVDGIPYIRGIIGADVNAGKTMIAALIINSLQLKSIILINNAPLFKQFLKDMPILFNDWGYIQGSKIKWGKVMVVMAQTVSSRSEELRYKLNEYQVLIFDECHLLPNKTNKRVVKLLTQTVVRVGLSGTPFNHKDKTKNMDVRAFFGEVMFGIGTQELIDGGFSSRLVIKILKGNEETIIKGNYQKEYERGITINAKRNDKIHKRVAFYLKRKKYPLMVVCKYHQHVELMYKDLQIIFGDKYKVSYIHHKVKDRDQRLNQFKDGKIDIMVASLIIKIGQNMPLMKTLINAAGGDSSIQVIQIMGRILRTDKDKSKKYMDDFFDLGAYLQLHSKHRIKYYKSKGFELLELYKD